MKLTMEEYPNAAPGGSTEEGNDLQSAHHSDPFLLTGGTLT